MAESPEILTGASKNRAGFAMDTERRIKTIKRFIERMPSLPTSVTKVLEICNRPDTSPNDLNRVISLDPVLTGQVMKLINSAYYALPNRITSLTRAIIMLGINTVKNLALATSVLSTFRDRIACRRMTMDDFWAHSLGVGVIAKTLAQITGVTAAEQETYFVAGLLHDLGKIPLANKFPGEYDQVVETVGSNGASLVECEQKVFGVDHLHVGGMIAGKWRLNHDMQAAITGHCLECGDVSDHTVAIMVALADYLAVRFDIGAAGNREIEDKVLIAALGRISIRPDKLEGLRSKVEQEIERARDFLKIAGRED